MRRLPSFAAGLLAGVALSGLAVGITVSALVARAWLSPARDVERLTGISLPSKILLLYERSQHDGWFGDGYSLRVFSLPAEAGRALVSSCPVGFESRPLALSGIPEEDSRHVRPSGSPSCVFRRWSRDRDETVVIAPDRVFHFRIDS